MKKIILILFLIIPIYAHASAPTRTFTYVSNTTIDPNQNNTNENSLYSYLQTGVDTYAVGSITGAAISSSASIPYASLSLAGSIVRADLSSALTPFILPSGAVFFMASGACPTGTTDVSVTYANKYVKINTTPLTSTGVVLTGTTDSHTLDVTEIPAHTHTVPGKSGGAVGTTANFPRADTAPNDGNITSNSTGGGGGHTHTLSTATTLEPSSITMRACQVN